MIIIVLTSREHRNIVQLCTKKCTTRLDGGRLEEPRWPDDWLFALHLFAGMAALAVVFFLIFGRKLLRERCVSCFVMDKVKSW